MLRHVGVQTNEHLAAIEVKCLECDKRKYGECLNHKHFESVCVCVC